jgi:hypothetical protein
MDAYNVACIIWAGAAHDKLSENTRAVCARHMSLLAILNLHFGSFEYK